MYWDWDTLNWVYERTDGYCRYCGKKIYWSNYGMAGERGAWQVEHSVPVALGGTNYRRNLWPACIDCNQDKGTMTGTQYMRLFPEPRRSASGDGVATALAGAFLLYLLYQALSQAKSARQ